MMITNSSESKDNSTAIISENQETPIAISYSPNFPHLLKQLGSSIFISTYQAGRLVILRHNGQGINAHFRTFPKAMGIAVNPVRLAVGTKYEIQELYNQTAVAPKLEPINTHDACYLLRNTHVTGDIDIHEMNYIQNQLWFINTRFSCLCTVDPAYSFNPRWRPPFVTSLAPQDRCHLNGLAVVNNRPKYVTALGETNTPQGWRENKANGGILMDIETNEIVLRGLSMPHSPRYYGNNLLFLESGKGSLAVVNSNYQVQTLAQFPGFTRGLDFYGNLAFIGLSQVRETATFSGLPLTEKFSDRMCGLWVYDLKTGQTVAFLKFDSGVEEIFAVQVLFNYRFPEVLTNDSKLLATSYALSPEALADVDL
jgi:uncharacterized protein (TIGR03032 family)